MKHITFALPILRRVVLRLVIAVGIPANLMAGNSEKCEELLQRAQEFLAQHQPEEARKPILEATETCPTNPQGYNLLGILYDMQNRFEEAQRAQRKAVALSPTWPGFHNNLAISYARAGKIAESIAEFQKALRFDPHNMFANANLADYCLKEKKYRRALDYLQNAHADQSTDPSLVYELAQAYFGAGETKSALQTAARVTELAPSDVKIRFALGLLLAENNQYAEAVKQFEAIPVRDRDFAVNQNLGLAYSKLQQHAEAQKAFEQAVRLDPSNPDPYFRIGLDLVASRSFDQAMYTLSHAHQMAPQRLDITCALAKALIQGRDLLGARDLLAEVQADFPNNAAVMQTEGDLYVAQGEDSKALDSYRRALQYDPENIQARLALAKVCLRLGQSEQSKIAFERILRADPQNAEANAGLGRIALRAGQEDLALQELSRALSKDPNELDANEDLAAIKVRRSRLTEAQAILEKLVTLDPMNARYHYLLGRVLLKLGRAEEAQRELARSEQIGGSTHKNTTEP